MNLMICRTNEDFTPFKKSLNPNRDSKVTVKTNYTTVRKMKVTYSGILASLRVIGEGKF